MSLGNTNRHYSAAAPGGKTAAASGKRILYDAKGERIKDSPLSNKLVRALLFYVLPYLVINGIILLLVCSTPDTVVEVEDTNDYISTNVNFTVKSLLPISELNITMETLPVEYTKDGKNYSCAVYQNGTLCIEAKSINGMSHTTYTDVALLDDTAPSVDESTANISRGKLTFYIDDTQSGVNFDSIYGIVDDGETVYPSDIDKNLGLVTMTLPLDTGTIELHFEDMVGNARSGKITVTTTDGSDDTSAEFSDDITDEDNSSVSIE